jgi:diacylglycerol kinase family enzyme
MNFRAEGGGVPMAPKADATDGKLSVCSVYGVPKWRTFFCLPFLATGTHTWIHGFDISDTATCHIHLSHPMTVHADGEYCGELADLTFRCIPKSLRVLR